MHDDTPRCQSCGRTLDRIDHYGIEHTLLRHDEYGPVTMQDGSADGEPYGTASEVDLRCGYCGVSLRRNQRPYFYKRWVNVKEAIKSIGGRPDV